MPPKILVINREVLKPGKNGNPHQRTESAFVRALAAAKDTTYYLGMDAITGPSRSLFFTGYDSFADWEKRHCPNRRTPCFPPRLIALPSPMATCCNPTRPACTTCATTTA